MAMAARAERTERASAVRSRVHGGANDRAMVKSTASVAHVARRPQLVVVAPHLVAGLLSLCVVTSLFLHGSRFVLLSGKCRHWSLGPPSGL